MSNIIYFSEYLVSEGILKDKGMITYTTKGGEDKCIQSFDCICGFNYEVKNKYKPLLLNGVMNHIYSIHHRKRLVKMNLLKDVNEIPYYYKKQNKIEQIEVKSDTMEEKYVEEKYVEEKYTEGTKFSICVFPTQFGKTFYAIKRITEEIKRDNTDGKSVHVVCTMNTLLNNSQFCTRLNTIEETYGKGSVCVLSSKNTKNYIHVKNILELKGICADKQTCPRLIVMCSNTTRFNDVSQIFEFLQNNQTSFLRAFAYFDEFHEYTNKTVREMIVRINNMEITRGLIALTATPGKVFTDEDGFFSKIPIVTFSQTNNIDNYVGFHDMEYILNDEFFPIPYCRPCAFQHQKKSDEVVGYVKHILLKYPSILRKNARIFIPGHTKRTGHDEIREFIFSRNSSAVVCVVNGKEKSLQFIDSCKKVITIMLESKQEELCDTIYRIVQEYNLYERPLVITGLLCVGMGQTLTHKHMGSFTSAIFSHLDLTNDELYQLFGRITGRMKQWGDKYVKTQVYCPTIARDRFNLMEECANYTMKNLGGQIINREQYHEPIYSAKEEVAKNVINNIRQSKQQKQVKHTDHSDKEFKVFDTEEEAIVFAKTILNYKFNKNSKYAIPKALQQDNQKPTVEYLLNRMWGLDEKITARKVITRDDKWCVYWRPSLIKKN